jgi:20S proteasome alpha/beta subunit
LYQVDPSGFVFITNCIRLFMMHHSCFIGAAFGWKAAAIGKNYINAKNFLERRYTDDIELDDAVHVALLTLRESFEGEMTEFNIEVS